MAVARDVKWRTAREVQKACLVYVSLMVGAADANIRHAAKELKEALCSARRTVGVNDALLKGVPKVLRAARLFARDMVEGRGALSLDALNVFMVGHLSVLLTEVARDVLWQGAPKVHEEGLISVFAMVGANGVNLRAVARAHKGALISVRHMEEGSDVHGDNLDPSMATKLMAHVGLSQGGKPASVRHMEPSFRISEFTVALLWGLCCRNLTSQQTRGRQWVLLTPRTWNAAVLMLWAAMVMTSDSLSFLQRRKRSPWLHCQNAESMVEA